MARTLGRNLRAWRESHDLSQEKAAHMLGYHRTYWADLERAERNPTLRTVERLAAQLGVKPLELLRPAWGFSR